VLPRWSVSGELLRKLRRGSLVEPLITLKKDERAEVGDLKIATTMVVKSRE
jgi:hypothetical protein